MNRDQVIRALASVIDDVFDDVDTTVEELLEALARDRSIARDAVDQLATLFADRVPAFLALPASARLLRVARRARPSWRTMLTSRAEDG
ncbi:hypothetical protein KRR39_08035 [Nocardioides panacis]|uniref:Uncharacterized protein n=1 Tax=Nocardioides panacis TaxID=2849501 RepID=A0A975T163_9ACTN|nr:hypothetical protein [Nocardioides panacis]QWZ09677.1 hypothetical protein KRR39_08035 [Nocardioides panacis]